MSEFLQRVEAAIQKRRLLARGQKILVAVSGGADSMVLLHALNSLAKKNRWKIFVAHFNHQLRGRASDADEKLVRKISNGLKCSITMDHADVKKFAAKSKLSIEMAARKLRHEFLARTAKRLKAQTVALAHHADDQVELFFMRLLRGAGGEGLAGMKWRSPSPADKTTSLVRPLLGFSKDELLQFARERKIQFREDASNTSTDFLRNRIRNELLPLLQKNYQPGLTKTVLRVMEIVGAESEFVGAAARQWLAQPRILFAKLPVAVQRKILQFQLTEVGVVADFEMIEYLRESPKKWVSISSGLSVLRQASGKVELRSLSAMEFNSKELAANLAGRAGQANFGGRKFYWRIQLAGKPAVLQKQSGIEFFDAEKIGGEIILRHWRAGDRFQPIGLASEAKLQDLFVNAKIPAARRRELVLATTAAGEIFWVEGLRIGERFKLSPQTKRRLIWHWQRLDLCKD